MKCPQCGDDKHLYKKADVRWDPDHEDWVLGDTYEEVECTTCDYEGVEDDCN